MAPKIEAYVDTAAFISVLDQSDSYHPTFRRLFNSPPSLITSALVISEGYGWFLRRYDSQRAIQFLQFIDELPNLAIRPFDASELHSARALLRKFVDQKLTLADAHGLAIIRHLSIRTCWSTDRHLRLTGAALVV
jgi:predicted nucleic acid-binding protein